MTNEFNGIIRKVFQFELKQKKSMKILSGEVDEINAYEMIQCETEDSPAINVKLHLPDSKL